MSILVLLPLLAALSCCTEEPVPNPPEGPQKLEVLWRTPIVPNPSVDYTIAMNPVLFEDRVVFNSEYELNGFNAPVMFLDTANGTITDYWSDYISGPYTYSDESAASEDRYLFLSGQRSVECVNLLTKQTQWHGPIGDNGPFIYTSNGYLYRGIEYNGQNPQNNSAAVMRTPVEQMNWDTVYAFDRTDSYKPGFDSMGFGKLSSGDDVIAWKNRSLTGSSDRTDIFAYNLTADTLLWRNMDLNEASGIIPLKVENNVVYGIVLRRAFAIDLHTGNTLWSINLNSINPTLPLDFGEGDFHIEGNRMLIKGASDELIALKTSNGQVDWIIQDHPYGIDDRFTLFEGKIFYCAGELVIADVITGQSLLKKSQIEHLGDVRSRIVIDPLRRVMYMHNGREALCVKIPDDL